MHNVTIEWLGNTKPMHNVAVEWLGNTKPMPNVTIEWLGNTKPMHNVTVEWEDTEPKGVSHSRVSNVLATPQFLL
jgi:plastocyanin